MHRYPAAMARRAHELCVILVDHYDGDAGADLAQRAQSATSSTGGCASCPATARRRPRSSWPSWPSGSGKRPTGWEEAAAPFCDNDAPLGGRHRLAAETLAKVREFKKAKKAAGKGKAD